MEILCDHKNLKELESSLEVFQSTRLARTKAIPKRLRQIFREGTQPIPINGAAKSLVGRSLLDSSEF